MTYTKEQIQQLYINIQKIVEYIETNILPHITYQYETKNFGPMEIWGRLNENKGQRYYIALNGPYADKIRFYYGIGCYNAEDLVENVPDVAVNFLKYWRFAKDYMHTEIANHSDVVELINNFEV